MTHFVGFCRYAKTFIAREESLDLDRLTAWFPTNPYLVLLLRDAGSIVIREMVKDIHSTSDGRGSI